MIAYGKKWSIIILKGIKKKTVVNSFNIKKITYLKNTKQKWWVFSLIVKFKLELFSNKKKDQKLQARRKETQQTSCFLHVCL